MTEALQRTWTLGVGPGSDQLLIDLDGAEDVPNRGGVPFSTFGGRNTFCIERRSDGIQRFTLSMLTSNP